MPNNKTLTIRQAEHAYALAHRREMRLVDGLPDAATRRQLDAAWAAAARANAALSILQGLRSEVM